MPLITAHMLAQNGKNQRQALVFKATIQSCQGQTLVVSKDSTMVTDTKYGSGETYQDMVELACFGLTLSSTCAVNFLLAFLQNQSTTWSNSFINHNKFSKK